MEKQNSIKAVLFDFDGTLVFLPTDYEKMRSRVKGLFAQFGIDSDFCPIIESIKHSLREMERRNLHRQLVLQTKEKAFAIIEEAELEATLDAKLVEGAREILSSLKKSGIAVAIVSRNGRNCIQTCFSKFDLPNPDLIVARDDISELKPHPRHFEIALKKLKVKGAEAMAVGNSFHDIQGAEKASILSVLIAAGNKKELDGSAQPHYRISKLVEVYDIIGLNPLEELEHV